MTTDVKLLPLPEPDNDVIVDGEGNEAFFEFFTDEKMEAYARANMEPLIAENERLRGEVETLRDGLDYLRQMQGAADVLELRAKAARSERLAEALRVAVDLVDSDVIRVGPYPSDREELIAALTQWNAALDQEDGRE